MKIDSNPICSQNYQLEFRKQQQIFTTGIRKEKQTCQNLLIASGIPTFQKYRIFENRVATTTWEEQKTIKIRQ